LVFNKVDLIDDEKLAELKEMFPDEDKVFISVKSNI
jgi:50S ribosomal subunit-associated GTPase HflX